MGCGNSKAMPVAGPDDLDLDLSRLNQGHDDYQQYEFTSVAPSVKSSVAKVGTKPADSAVAVALRAKRKGVIFGDNAVQVDANYVKRNVRKDPAVRDMIAAALHDNVLFAALSSSETEDLINSMEPRLVKEGTLLIQQGDPGDNFYVIEYGKFDILVNDKKVADWGEGTKNRTVGELALLYNSPRAATVRATTPAKLWSIDRVTFRNVIAQTSHAQHQRLKTALRRGILQDLKEEQLDKVANAATIVTYSKGDQIIKRGEEGEVFFIIETGSVICKNLPGEQSNNVLHEGDYFGERALLKREPRVADVYAETDCSLIALHREDFENLLGHLRDLLEYNLGMRLLLCVPIFAGLQDEDRAAVFAGLQLVTFADGKVIVQQGSAPAAFFLIKEGRVIIQQTGDSKQSTKTSSRGNLLDSKATSESNLLVARRLGELGTGQWFGDRELVSPAAASSVSYIARGSVQCFVLDRAMFLKLLAPLRREPPAAQGRAAIAASGDSHSLAGVASPASSPDAVAGSVRSELASTTALVNSGAGGGPRPTALDARRPLGESMLKQAPVRQRLGIPLRELEQRATLGTGTFGRVRLVHHKRSNQVFALKMLQKSQIVALKQQQNIMNEKEILWRAEHPFIIRLFDTYKDRDRLYMLLELVQGGELFSRLQNSPTPGRITSPEARFYAACVLDAFEYLHAMHILYRDLKPENLLIDAEGYLKLVDFGFAKTVRDRTYTLCGTPEYLAPELVLGKGHDKGVDYWALGILLYEEVAGFSPFADQKNNDQMAICRSILKGDVQFPAHVRDKDLRDVIQKLLVKDVTKRLGCLKNGALDVKDHRYFRPIDWGSLQRKELEAPWRPKLSNPLDTSHFDEYDEVDHVEPYADNGSNWDATF